MSIATLSFLKDKQIKIHLFYFIFIYLFFMVSSIQISIVSENGILHSFRSCYRILVSIGIEHQVKDKVRLFATI